MVLAITTACVLGLVTSTLLPTISNGAVDERQAWLAVAGCSLGALACLSYLVHAWGQPNRSWLLPTSMMTAWGIVVGSLATLSNLSAFQVYSYQLEQAEMHYRQHQGHLSEKASFPRRKTSSA